MSVTKQHVKIPNPATNQWKSSNLTSENHNALISYGGHGLVGFHSIKTIFYTEYREKTIFFPTNVFILQYKLFNLNNKHFITSTWLEKV